MLMCFRDVGKMLVNNKPFYVVTTKSTNPVRYMSKAYTLPKEATTEVKDAKTYHRTVCVELYRVHDGKYELIEEYKAT